LEAGFAVELEVGFVAAGFEVGFAVELEVGFVAAGFEVDVDVPVDVVCPITCNTAIKQKTTVAVAIRFIAGLPLNYLTSICRPMRALGAIASAEGLRRFPIEPSTMPSTISYAGDYSTSGEACKITDVLGQN
jgi:hypothetical protein